MFHARLSPHALQIHMTIMLKKVYRNTSNFLSLAILLAILFLRKIIFLLWKGVVFIYLVGYKISTYLLTKCQYWFAKFTFYTIECGLWGFAKVFQSCVNK